MCKGRFVSNVQCFECVVQCSVVGYFVVVKIEDAKRFCRSVVIGLVLGELLVCDGCKVCPDGSA